MGQITVTVRDTQAYGGPPIVMPAAVRDTAATTCTLHFANQDAAAQGFSARLYWTAAATFDTANEVGAQVSGNHAYLSPVDVVFGLSGVAAGYLWGWWGMDSPGFVGTLDLTLFDDLAYCAYGTQLQSRWTRFVNLAPNLLQLAAGIMTDGAAWPIVAYFAGSLFDAGDLCTSSRGAPVTFTASELLELAGMVLSPPRLDLVQKATAWLGWALWPTFCECIGGSPSPNPYPPISQPAPPGAPPGPFVGYACDNTDLCTAVQQLALALNALLQQQRQLTGMVTLIQRQGVPFGYVTGTVHGPLSGQGEFTVADILGLSIDATVIPLANPPTGGDPQTYRSLGKISVGTTDGWERTYWVTHDPYLILPISGAVTKVGWTFPSGVIAYVTELLREP